MYRLLVLLMFTAALSQLGMSASDVRNCHSRACLQQLEKRSRDVLHVDWKPMSAFPEEAKRFR
ncbi:MAG: hypothetical protein HYW49_12560 [Deltaproteobacteria bacterium]|nr:hypothetical protein [Deltaproteobacteria bacterium]